MKRMEFLRPAVVGLAVLVGVALYAGATLAQSSPDAAMAFTVTIDETQATITPADFGQAPAAGQLATEDAPVDREGEKVGLAETTLAVTRVDGDDVAVLITCSVELPEGNLLFSGSFHLAAMMTGAQLPVVGGTGQYAGAIGTVILTAAEDGTSTTLEFDIHQP